MVLIDFKNALHKNNTVDCLEIMHVCADRAGCVSVEVYSRFADINSHALIFD